MLLSPRPSAARQLALAAGVLGAAALTLTSCDKGANGDFAKTKSGIEYKIFKQEGGKYVAREVAGGEDPAYKTRVNQIIALHIETRTAKDSVLGSSRQQRMGQPVRLQLTANPARGTEQEAFALLQAGDSAVFHFSTDSLEKKSPGQPLPAFLKKHGKYISMLVKVVKIQDEASARVDQEKAMEEQQRQMRAYTAEQDKKDDATIQEYLKKNNLAAAKKTSSGVYYVITQPGVGAKAKPGQTVSLQYRGSLLDGNEFDASAKHGGQPFSFPLGRGQVIPGWDEAVALLNKGSKATFLIPSSLGYGRTGSPPAIPADAPLRFDVELVDVK